MDSRNDSQTMTCGRTITYDGFMSPRISDYPDGACGVCDGNGWIPTRTGGINCPRCNYPELRHPLTKTWTAHSDR